MMPLSSKSRRGFSLVEIVIAIGIAAVALAAIGGIFGVTNQSSLDSSRDTLMTTMIGQVMGDMRPLPFDVLWNADPRGATRGYLTGLQLNVATIPPTNPPTDSFYYFTSEGVMCEPQDTTTPSPTSYAKPPQNAVYRCKVTKTRDIATQSFGTPAGYNRLQLDLRFDWPIPPKASDIGPNVRESYGSIARYF